MQTVTTESFRNSHPVILTSDIVSRSLEGVHLVFHKGLFQTILTGEETPQRLFTDQDVTFLTPLILTALAKSTPEEQIIFSLPARGTARLSGNILYLDGTLFLTLTEYPGLSHPIVKGGRPTSVRNPTGTHPITILFMPREAEYTGPPPVREDQSSHLQLGIDLSVLPTTRDSENAIPHSQSTQKSPAPHSGDPTPSATQNLREDLKALQQELERQKTEIQRLKNRP